MRKFSELTEAEKLDSIFCKAHMQCQEAIEAAVDATQGDREERARLTPWIEYNRDMQEFLRNRCSNQTDRELMEEYGVHSRSARLRR